MPGGRILHDEVYARASGTVAHERRQVHVVTAMGMVDVGEMSLHAVVLLLVPTPATFLVLVETDGH
jgi:hypothetical protein